MSISFSFKKTREKEKNVEEEEEQKRKETTAFHLRKEKRIPATHSLFKVVASPNRCPTITIQFNSVVCR